MDPLTVTAAVLLKWGAPVGFELVKGLAAGVVTTGVKAAFNGMARAGDAERAWPMPSSKWPFDPTRSQPSTRTPPTSRPGRVVDFGTWNGEVRRKRATSPQDHGDVLVMDRESPAPVIVGTPEVSEIYLIKRVRRSIEYNDLPEIVGLATNMIEAIDELHHLSKFEAFELRRWIERYEHENQVEILDFDDLCAVLKMATNDDYGVELYPVRTPVRASVIEMLMRSPVAKTLLDEFLERRPPQA